MPANSARLYTFSGLPGTGKTTLARRLARHVQAAYLRIDTVEQALRDLCGVDVQGEGYRLSYRMAQDNLREGVSVVADCCNPIGLTRDEWNQAALEAGATPVNIEVACSDPAQHRARVEARTVDVPGLTPPSWASVLRRDYEPWPDGAQRITIDTTNATEEQSFALLLRLLTDWI